MLCILAGPTCVGKTIIGNKLVQKPNIKRFTTHTTRPLDEADRLNGNEPQYIHHSKEEFQKMISENTFFEYVKHAEHYYGSMFSDVEKAIKDKDNFYIAILNIEGIEFYKKYYPEIVSIYLLPESKEVLRERIMSRQRETAAEIELRLKIAYENEIPRASEFDYNIKNIILEDTVNIIYELLITLLNK